MAPHAPPSLFSSVHRLLAGLLVLMLSACAGAGEKAPVPARDRFGDPLPPGAVARLGTVRLRHADSILAIAFTPDGKQLVSAGEDAVRVWDAATGRPLRSFAPGKPQGIVGRSGGDFVAASLSPDGRLIALSKYSEVRRVEVWEVKTGKLVHRLGDECMFRYLSFSPDGKRLAAFADQRIGRNWTIDIWDVATGARVSQWPVSEGDVQSLIFSADGKTLIVGGSEKALLFRDVGTGKEVRRLRNLPSDVSALVLSPHGDQATYIELVETKPEHRWHRHAGVRAFLIDLRTGKELRHWMVSETERDLVSLAFSPGGNKVAACSLDGPLRLWDTKSGKETKPVFDGSRNASAVAFSPDGGTLAVVCNERVIHLIDPTTGKERRAAAAHLGSVSLVTAMRNGHIAFTAGDDGIIYRWDTRTGRELSRLLGHRYQVWGLALSPDERALFSTSSDQTLRVWDVASGEELRQVRPWNPVGPLKLSPDGVTLTSVVHDSLFLFHPASGKRRPEQTLKEKILDVAFSSDSSRLTAVTIDGKITWFETRMGGALSRWNVPGTSKWTGGRERMGGLSSDGRLAAFAESHRSFRVLDVEAKQEISRLAKPPGLVTTIAFAPDGRTLAWAEGFGVIHWLEVASGRERWRLSGHVGRVMRMVFTADGKRLLSASEDATALVWDLLRPGTAKLSAQQQAACWTDLADKDAAKAYRAMCRLIAAPADALAYLRLRLKPVKGMDEKSIERLVADVDADAFAVREKATEQLRKLGELAEPACRKALASRPTLESRRRLEELLADIVQYRWRLSPELLRQLRAIEVLERIATPEAERYLELLAGGAAGARLTREARAVVQRLKALQGAKP